ncbi:MAG: Glu/Leu/Phe/Val dehydrogenase dimerization domain-containing protein [Nitrospirota bacterium]
MDLFSEMKAGGHEQILFCSDAKLGLLAIIAIHSTRFGPALGGCRMWPYPSPDAALSDVLRLSKAMTYKAAISDLPLGGGKSVIMGDPKKDKTPERMIAFAKNVDALGGRYIVAEDVGIDISDIELFRTVTPHVAGFAEEAGGTGDPSPQTALGVFCGMAACLEEVAGNDTFDGCRVAIQGFGKVGYALAKLLYEAGAKITLSDMDPERVAIGCREFDCDIVHPHEIHKVECDIFAPCAMGGILNDRTIPALSCKIVAGAANNQLDREELAIKLQERGILYAPDYVINAGGLIHVSTKDNGERRLRVDTKIRAIGGRLKTIFEMAKSDKISTSDAADHLAEKKLYG